MVLGVQDWYSAHELANVEEAEADHQPGQGKADGDQGIDLGASTARDGEVEDGEEHEYVEQSAQQRRDEGAEERAPGNSGEGDQADETGHAVQQEGADIGDERDLGEPIDTQDAIRAHSGRNDGQHHDPDVRSAEPAVQEAEDQRQFAILAHRVRYAHARIQAGERGADQGNRHSDSQDRGKGNAVAAKERVAQDGRHVSYGRAGGKCSREAGAAAVGIAGIDEEVRREVLQEVEDDGLDHQREDDAARDIATWIFSLRRQRRRGLKADDQQDRNGGLEEQSTEVVGCNHTQRAGMQVVNFGMLQTVDDGERGKEDQGDDLDGVDDNVREGRTGDADVGNRADNACKDDADQHFLPGGAKAGVKGLDDVGDEQTHECYHHTWIDPVVQVRCPAHDEFRQARKFEMAVFFAMQDRGFGEVIRTARSGFWIALRERGIGRRGERAR